MGKKLTVIVDGKKHDITYNKEGDKYSVESTSPEISKHIPGSFAIKNGQAIYLQVSDQTDKIFGQIIRQINMNETGH